MDHINYPRVKSLLTIEGLALTIILGFVAVCSILRNVNLLVVVSGMMILPMILCWRLSRNSVRNLAAARNVSNRTHANLPVNIQWEIFNNYPLDLFNLKVIDGLRQIISRNGKVKYSRRRKSIQSSGAVTFDQVRSNKSNYSSYQVNFAERGIYEIGPAVVENRFPLGLVKSWFRMERKTQIYVAPQLGNLEPDWSSRISQYTHGTSLKTGRKGMMEEEFFAIREWRSGDNKRKIHWRSSAKLGEPMVKQYDRTTEQNFAIVLDLVANSRDIASGAQYNRMAAECEFILSFVATIVSRWVDQPFGQLCLGLATDQSQVWNSNSENQFISKSMRAMAAAQHGSGNQLGNTLKLVTNHLAPNTSCIVLSTRHREAVLLEVEPTLLDQFSWIQSTDPVLDRIFEVPKKDVVLPSEFSPA